MREREKKGRSARATLSLAGPGRQFNGDWRSDKIAISEWVGERATEPSFFQLAILFSSLFFFFLLFIFKLLSSNFNTSPARLSPKQWERERGSCFDAKTRVGITQLYQRHVREVLYNVVYNARVTLSKGPHAHFNINQHIYTYITSQWSLTLNALVYAQYN